MAQTQPGRPAQSRDLLILTSVFAGICAGCGLILCCCLYHCIKRRRRRQELEARRRRPKMAYAHPRYLDANGYLVRQEGSHPWRRGHHFHSRWPSQMPVDSSAYDTRPRRERRSRRRPLPEDFYAADTSPRTQPLQQSGEGYRSRNMDSPNRMRGEPEISRPRPAHLRPGPTGFGPLNADRQQPAQVRHRTSRRRSQRIQPPFDEHERGQTSRRTSYSREAPEARGRTQDENEIEYEGVETSMQGPPSVDSPRDLIDEFPASPQYSGNQPEGPEMTSSRFGLARPFSASEPIARPASPLLMPRGRSRTSTISLTSTCVEISSNSVASRGLHMDDFSSVSDSMFAPISPVASTWRKDELRRGSWERWTELARSE